MPETYFKGMFFHQQLQSFVLTCALWISAYALLSQCVQGQQAYNENDQDGYLCSDNKTLTECNAYIEYRARTGDTLQLVSDRFQVSRNQIAGASNFSDNGQQLFTNQQLLIPIASCQCVGGRSQYNVSYVIQTGDTFYLMSIGTFEGLTTYQAIERSNPSAVPTNLMPGNIVTVPIRCACPSTGQISKGIQVLVTYPITASDTLTSISSEWNISTNDIAVANELKQNANLLENTTLLLPFANQPQLRFVTPPPLTSPAPSPSVSPTPASTLVSTAGSSNVGLIVGVACGASAVVAVALCAVLLVFRRRKRAIPLNLKQYDSTTSYNTQVESADFAKAKSDLKKELLSGMSDLIDTDSPVWYNFEELQLATGDFSAAYRIQGSVYRGVVRDRLVAIKKMKGGMSQELKILCKVHHSNLIKLLGLSVSEEDHVYLVYEFAENGSLSDCLHNKYSSSKFSESSSSSPYLRWNMRLQIALDVASALEYIHDYTNPSFVHKDLKSSNILLDENFRAKVANFGMAKLASDQGAPPMLTKHIAGTQGYMAPEYLAHGLVSPKLDVYAYGVVLLELLSGQEAIMIDTDGERLRGKDRFLSASITPILDSDHKVEMLREWMDPVLQDAYPQDCVLEVAELARSCVDNEHLARPSMKEITYKLSKLFQTSLDWESVSANMERVYIDTTLEGR